MGIYIKDMVAPYSCSDCDFCSGPIIPDDIYICNCSLDDAYSKRIPDVYSKPDWCPLTEVPEHGDLIDRQYLIDTVSAMIVYRKTPDDIYWMIKDAPTVIPASKDGAE